MRGLLQFPHPIIRKTQNVFSNFRLKPEVSVAVLLDNFVTASTLMENQENASKLQERKAFSQFQNPLQPLILRLADRYARGFKLAS
jgi:hypothetical protein